MVLTGCGGGGGSGGSAAGGTATAPGKESTAVNSATSADVQAPPAAARARGRERVVTPADIRRRRDLERDRPAPIDRGEPAPRKKGEAAREAVAENIGGQWAAAMSWPINAIHAVLMPDGKVLSYGTDPAGAQGAQLYYDVWNPPSNAHSLLQHSTRTDLFCSAQSVLPESGQVLLVGGDTRGVTPDRVNFGVPDVNLFDPFAMTMAAAPKMAYARWYGSTVPLADSRVLVVGGVDDGSGTSVTMPEIYTPGGGWKKLPDMPWTLDLLYPRATLAPNGKVVVATDNRLASIDTAAGRMSIVGDLPNYTNWTMPWAIYDRGKMLVIDEDGGAMVIDYNGATPTATVVPGPGPNRIWASATVLPDGRVLVTGGSASENDLVDPGYTATIWDPKTRVWTAGAAAQKPRLYHSSALLLPDATVLTAGGGSPGPVINLNAEVYSPPYLFDSSGQRTARPMINTVPAQVALGAALRISAASSRPIQRVTLLRTASVTHSTDFEQRFLELPFTQAAGDSNIDITLNESPNIVPPGHYLLFVIDNAGVPSIGKIIKVSGAWAQVAVQAQTLTVPASTLLRYGVGETWIEKTATGSFTCDNAFFGADPAPGIPKACQVLAPRAAGITAGPVPPPQAPPAPGTTLASEDGFFTVPANTLVRYGAGTQWVEKTVGGTVPCTNAFFGGDPAPNVAKTCVAGAVPPPPPAPAPPAPSGALAAEGGSFTVSASTLVRYGAGTRWIEKMVNGTVPCTNAYFGSDPAPNVAKACYAGAASTPPPPPPPPAPPPPAPAPAPAGALAPEGGSFTVQMATLVRYGADSRWIEKTVTGTVPCTNASFGSDPAPNVVKACYAGAAPAPAPPPPPPAPPAGALAAEGGTFTVAAPTLVRYGADTRWISKTVTGTATCGNAFFGADPAPYVVKSCVAG